MKKLGVLLSLLFLSSPGLAINLQVDSTAQGLRYYSGGVGLDEREAVNRQFGHYGLRIEVAEKSGAYIVDVGIRLSDASGRSLLEVHMDGPVLLVDVPPGTYRIDASYGAQQQSRKVTVSAGQQTKTTFLWSTTGMP